MHAFMKLIKPTFSPCGNIVMLFFFTCFNSQCAVHTTNTLSSAVGQQMPLNVIGEKQEQNNYLSVGAEKQVYLLKYS